MTYETFFKRLEASHELTTMIYCASGLGAEKVQLVVRLDDMRRFRAQFLVTSPEGVTIETPWHVVAWPFLKGYADKLLSLNELAEDGVSRIYEAG